jgi:hypothetical protein
MYVALVGGEERGIQCFIGKHLGKEPLGRPRRRWKGIIKNGSSSNRDKRRTIMNAVVNLFLQEKMGTS